MKLLDRVIMLLLLAGCLAAALSLSGCGMLLTINPIGMLGIVHHPSHHGVPNPCIPKRPGCVNDSGMRP